ncbi:MAG: ATP-dependent Clp protease adaptor ClpS, partial [Pyrinomonadaceae bacterium]
MPSYESEDELAVATKTQHKVSKPPLYKVLLHNDDYTTMEFVIFILQTVFNRTESDAVMIMLEVHTQGIGVAGVYTFEIAETRAAKVTRLAQSQEFPLRCSI